MRQAFRWTPRTGLQPLGAGVRVDAPALVLVDTSLAPDGEREAWLLQLSPV